MMRWPVVLLLCAVGCGHLTLSIEAPQSLNGERPVRMLVRAVEPGDFARDSYQQVAEKVVMRDDSVLLSRPIYPGVVTVARVPRPSGKSVAVYFFFTSPRAGGEYKTLIAAPLPYRARIRLDDDTIQLVRRGMAAR